MSKWIVLKQNLQVIIVFTEQIWEENYDLIARSNAILKLAISIALCPA